MNRKLSFAVTLYFLLFTYGNGQTITSPTLTQLQGEWSCISSIKDMSNIHTDEVYPNDEKQLTTIGNIQIKNDEISMFDYPCEYFYTSKLIVDSGSTRFSAFLYHSYWQLYYIHLSNDTLILRILPGKTRHYYIRDKFNANTIKVLKKDSINPTCLTNTWYLRNGYDSGYDGLGYVTFVFPYTLPKKLSITNENISYYAIKGRYIYIGINGIKRKFYIERLSLKNGRVTLGDTGNWYTLKQGVEYNYRIWYELTKEEDPY